MTRHVRGKVTWIDLESPTPEELRAVMHEYGVDPRVEEEIISPTAYPVVIPFPKYVYLILHFPVSDPTQGSRNQEVDFIVGKRFVITVRYEVIEPLYNLHKVFESEELLGVPWKMDTADELVERIIRKLYASIREETERIADQLVKIEADIFSGKERQTVHAISKAGRVLLRFETALARHGESLPQFLDTLTKPALFGAKFRTHALHITAERDHLVSLVGSYRAAATELRNTNDSLLSARQNSIMQKLTVLASAAFPLTLIAGVFGMNTEHMPFVNHPLGFWIILFLMLIALVGAIALFRIRKWL